MQVGQKRGREEVDTLDIGEDGQPKKRVRTGFPASQWITVYNKGMPMKQRLGSRKQTACSEDGWALPEPREHHPVRASGQEERCKRSTVHQTSTEVCI